MGKVRYKVTKEQLERTVESFVMESTGVAKTQKNSTGVKKTRTPKNRDNNKGRISESRLKEIQKIMENYDISEDELNEFWGKKTPEQLIAKGQKIVDSDRQARAIYNTIKRDESNYGENAANKYLMFIAQSKGNMLYATWEDDLKAPDDTMGFWTERGSGSYAHHSFGSGE